MYPKNHSKGHFPARPFSHCLLFALALCWLSFAPVQGANRTAVSLGGTPVVFPGGNFESPALPSSPGYKYNPSGTNWSFSGAGYTRNNTGFTAGNPSTPQGNQCLFLQGGGRVTQTISMVAGQYTFDFYAAQRGNHQASSQTLALYINGQQKQTFQPNGTAFQFMTSNAFFLPSGNHTIELRGLNPNGGDNTAFVDRFRYTRVKQVAISGFESPALPPSPGYKYAPTGGDWTFASGGGLTRNGTAFTSGNPNAPQGNQACFLQGYGTATRTISVAGNGFYRFRLKAALRGNKPTTKRVRIKLDGVELSEICVPTTGYSELISLTTYINAGTHTLQLQGVNPVSGDHTAFVDDVRMEMVHNWQDARVWGGTVPNGNDIATIPSGVAVAMSGTITASRVIAMGHLVAAQNRSATISAKNILAMGSAGLLEMGGQYTPYTQNATFTLTANSNDAPIMSMGNNFIGAMNGGNINLHGDERKSWSQLGANAADGDNQITMKEAVNWPVNSKILLVSSHKQWDEAEERTITGINGNQLTLNAPLSNDHTGVQKTYSQGGRSWTADLRAQVGMLTHNIKVQGNAAAASSGYGGHIMIMSGSKAYVSGIELYHMGQKAILGRYPFHWHMLGDVGQGQFFKRNSVHRSFNRAITIHGTESTLVEDNFCYDHIGHGLFLEDGSERFNVIKRNVVLLSKRPATGEQLTLSDNQFNQVQNRTPSSFWITNPQNTFEDNVAAGTEGTGFWFAFPQKPMGASATDPRFSSMKPHTLPLISFKGNMAHSCMSGFDIFDQLSATHSILPNRGWAESGLHFMDECTWYSNDLAIYSGIGIGGPVENLIFRDNIFIENKVGSMLASYSIIDNSVFVANSGENLIPSTRYAYRVYDGAGQVHNSHFVGWNATNANLLLNTGAAIKHPNHILTGNTKDHSGPVRISLPDFDIAPVYSGANAPGHPRFWSVVLKDVDGGLSGKANTTIIGNHPFTRVGDEFQPSGWTRTYRSDHQFALCRLSYTVPRINTPNVVVTRTKTGTSTESVYYVDGYKEHHQLPFIVNEGFEYTYTYESLPSTKLIKMHMQDASVGDSYFVRFKDFGKLGGLALRSIVGGLSSYSSLTALQNGTSSGYYRQSGGDLFIKTVATGGYQQYEIKWNTDFTVPALDTDGDQMVDALEITNSSRHPFTATDLRADFNQSSNFEGWQTSANISNFSVSNGWMSGTSINNGDAIIVNSAYNFKTSEVPYLKVRMRSSAATGVQFFFATDANPGFSSSRKVTVTHPGGNTWQTLTFNMQGHAAWNGTLTDLRLDPVSGVNKSFDINWIQASATAKYAGNDLEFSSSSNAVTVSPNPFQGHLAIALGESHPYQLASLLDLHGRVLKTKALSGNESSFRWDFPDLQLSGGIYLLHLTGAEGQQVIRIAKE